MMPKTLLLLALLVLTGCAVTSTKMSHYMGRSDTELVSLNGAPDLETKSSNGTRVMTWYQRDGYGRAACRENYTISQGKVVAWSHNCPM